MKAVIGIPGNILSQFDNNTLKIPVSYTPHGFIEALQNAGALPVIFPISSEEEAKQYVKNVDGILLAGGQDVSPLIYGEEPSLKLESTNPKRDKFELAVIQEAVKERKPLLAVCRGMQVYNVAMGGTLYQDVSFYPELSVQHVQATTPRTAVHTVDIDEDSWFKNIYGTKAQVNSFHHQALNELAGNLKAVAWSKDGLIEAFESKVDDCLHVGIQWHPELMIEEDTYSQKLFDHYVHEVIQWKDNNKVV